MELKQHKWFNAFAAAYENFHGEELSDNSTGIIRTVIDAKKNLGFEPNRNEIRILMKDASRIGSVMLIDSLICF